jgi:hypothetical protein
MSDGEFCSSQAPNGDSSTAHAFLPKALSLYLDATI